MNIKGSLQNGCTFTFLYKPLIPCEKAQISLIMSPGCPFFPHFQNNYDSNNNKNISRA